VATASGPASQPALADFLVYLGVELQVSKHTVAAYRSDLQRFLLGQATIPGRTAIDRHLASLLPTHAPASVARRLVIQRNTPRDMRGRVNSAFFVTSRSPGDLRILSLMKNGRRSATSLAVL